MENQKSPTKPANSWTASEKSELTQLLALIINGQNKYGETVSVKDTFAFFSFKLEGRFPMSSILYAINLHTDRKDTIPTPADIITIIEPAKAQITQADFIHAKKQWELEGYPSYSYYAMIVKDYEKQSETARIAPSKVEDPRIAGIIQNAAKAITKT